MVDSQTPTQGEVRPVTPEEREEVFRLQQQGMGVREIARRFNRAPSTISRILRGGARAAAGRRAGAAAVKAPARARQAGRAAGRQGAGARGAGRAGMAAGAVSRQELRMLEQRIARIESSLARMGSMIQPRGTGRGR